MFKDLKHSLILLSLIFYFLDNVINYWFSFPIYVCFNLFLVTYVCINSNISRVSLFIGPFILSFFIGFFTTGFHVPNIEVINIVLLISSFIYLKDKIIYKVETILLLSFLAGFLLILPSFFGVNAGSYEDRLNANVNDDAIEYLRKYNNGFFRIPQLASYFFGYLGLSFLFVSLISRKIIFFILFLASILIVGYVGSRTIIFSFIFALFTYYLRRKYIIYFIPIIIVSLLFVFNIEYFLQFFKGTIVFQYFSFIYTLRENFTSISRMQIWTSWLMEVKQFNFFRILFGNTFNESLLANQRNLNMSIWFHNDFFSIYYSYGIIAFGSYVVLFYKLIRHFKYYISKHIVLYVFVVSLIFSAFFNGLYFYSPFILIFLFISLVSYSKYYAEFNF